MRGNKMPRRDIVTIRSPLRVRYEKNLTGEGGEGGLKFFANVNHRIRLTRSKEREDAEGKVRIILF